MSAPHIVPPRMVSEPCARFGSQNVSQGSTSHLLLPTSSKKGQRSPWSALLYACRFFALSMLSKVHAPVVQLGKLSPAVQAHHRKTLSFIAQSTPSSTHHRGRIHVLNLAYMFEPVHILRTKKQIDCCRNSQSIAALCITCACSHTELFFTSRCLQLCPGPGMMMCRVRTEINKPHRRPDTICNTPCKFCSLSGHVRPQAPGYTHQNHGGTPVVTRPLSSSLHS